MNYTPPEKYAHPADAELSVSYADSELRSLLDAMPYPIVVTAGDEINLLALNCRAKAIARETGILCADEKQGKTGGGDCVEPSLKDAIQAKTESKVVLGTGKSARVVNVLTQAATLGGKEVFLTTMIPQDSRMDLNNSRSNMRGQIWELFERFGVGYWEYDTLEEKSEWSPGLLKIFGVDVDTEVTSDGSIGPSLVHPDDRGQVEKALSEAQRGLDPLPLEFRIIRPDGEERIIQSCGSNVIHNDAGEIIRVIAAVQDITKERRLEIQLLQLQKVEALGHLTRRIIHEFNNILATVRGNLQLVLEGGVASERHERMLSSAFRSAQRGADLTSRLQAYSSKQSLAPTLTSLHEIDTEFTAALEATHEPKFELREEHKAPRLKRWMRESDLIKSIRAGSLIPSLRRRRGATNE